MIVTWVSCFVNALPCSQRTEQAELFLIMGPTRILLEMHIRNTKIYWHKYCFIYIYYNFVVTKRHEIIRSVQLNCIHHLHFLKTLSHIDNAMEYNYVNILYKLEGQVYYIHRRYRDTPLAQWSVQPLNRIDRYLDRCCGRQYFFQQRKTASPLCKSLTQPIMFFLCFLGPLLLFLFSS